MYVPYLLVVLFVIFYLFIVPVPRISLQPSGYLQGVVGEMQDITCSVTITSEIDPDSVDLTWKLDDNIITTDNRVTIITNITENPFSFTYTTIIQFAYLMEGDEGNFTCNVEVDDMMESRSIVLENLRSMQILIAKHYLHICSYVYVYLFTVPSPVVEVTSIDTVEYGKTTTLECTAIAVRGITSRVDIFWVIYDNYNYTIVRRVDNVTANIVGNSAVYTDQLITPPLSINDSGRIYVCAVNINTTFGVTSYNIFVLDFAGKYHCV